MAPCPPSPCACPLTFFLSPPHPAQLKCPSLLLLSPVGRGRVRGETPSAEQASAPRLHAFPPPPPPAPPQTPLPAPPLPGGERQGGGGNSKRGASERSASVCLPPPARPGRRGRRYRGPGPAA